MNGSHDEPAADAIVRQAAAALWLFSALCAGGDPGVVEHESRVVEPDVGSEITCAEADKTVPEWLVSLPGSADFSETWTLGSHASYGPNWPHGTNNPAFGAQWHGCSTGSAADYEDVSSADVNHLGRGQSPYDSLIEQANYNNC